ncbi:MAG: uncharacterized protein A8A55_2187 [Amphiamblys sp. WSBS2006]|nr:MAG: uncharacterized protein A8A55_2187 [Amphiamblys sp. WSBS2006]
MSGGVSPCCFLVLEGRVLNCQKHIEENNGRLWEHCTLERKETIPRASTKWSDREYVGVSVEMRRGRTKTTAHWPNKTRCSLFMAAEECQGIEKVHGIRRQTHGEHPEDRKTGLSKGTERGRRDTEGSGIGWKTCHVGGAEKTNPSAPFLFGRNTNRTIALHILSSTRVETSGKRSAPRTSHLPKEPEA